jgi:hypothetical protein
MPEEMVKKPMTTLRAYRTLAKALNELRTSVGEEVLAKIEDGHRERLNSLIEAVDEKYDLEYEEFSPK